MGMGCLGVQLLRPQVCSWMSVPSPGLMQGGARGRARQRRGARGTALHVGHQAEVALQAGAAQVAAGVRNVLAGRADALALAGAQLLVAIRADAAHDAGRAGRRGGGDHRRADRPHAHGPDLLQQRGDPVVAVQRELVVVGAYAPDVVGLGPGGQVVLEALLAGEMPPEEGLGHLDIRLGVEAILRREVGGAAVDEGEVVRAHHGGGAGGALEHDVKVDRPGRGARGAVRPAEDDGRHHAPRTPRPERPAGDVGTLGFAQEGGRGDVEAVVALGLVRPRDDGGHHGFQEGVGLLDLKAAGAAGALRGGRVARVGAERAGFAGAEAGRGIVARRAGRHQVVDARVARRTVEALGARAVHVVPGVAGARRGAGGAGGGGGQAARVARSADGGAGARVGVGGTVHAHGRQRRGVGARRTLELDGGVRAREAVLARPAGDGRIGRAVHGVARRARVAPLRRVLAGQRQAVVAAVADGVLIRTEGVGRAQRAARVAVEDVPVVAQALVLTQVRIRLADALGDVRRRRGRRAVLRAAGHDSALAVCVSGAVIAVDVVGRVLAGVAI